jgi:hypothetical protein
LTNFARAEKFDDAARIIAALNAKNFHFKMAERGYDMIRCPTAAEWRSGKYRCRMAFAEKSLPKREQIRLIEEELKVRAAREE